MRSSTSRWVDFAILTCAFLLIAHKVDGTIPTGASAGDYGATAGSGSLARQIGTILLFFYGFFACIGNRKRAFSFDTLAAKFGTAFFAVMTLSLLWSIDLSSSAARWFGFFTYILAAAGAVKRLGLENIVRWFVFAQSSFLVLGLMNEVIHGTFHPLSGGYRFWGINEPNSNGNDAAVLIFASLAMMRWFPSSRIYRYTLATAVLVLLLTRSRTAVFSTIFALLIVYGIVALRGLKLGLYLYGMAILVSLPFVLNTFDIFNVSEAVSLGRADTTQEKLMGRIPLWTELYNDYIVQRPMLGYGYGAFWTPERIEDITSDQGWDIAAAHSIYVDAVLAVGFCGATLYVGALLSLLGNFLKEARTGKQEGFFFACLVCAVLFDGFSDSGPWYISSVYTFASVQAFFVLGAVKFQTVQPQLSAAPVADPNPIGADNLLSGG